VYFRQHRKRITNVLDHENIEDAIKEIVLERRFLAEGVDWIHIPQTTLL